MYYTDNLNPLGADKLCEGCIESYTLEHWGPAARMEGNVDLESPEGGDAVCTPPAAQASSASVNQDCEGWPASPRQTPPQEAAHARAKWAHAPVSKMVRRMPPFLPITSTWSPCSCMAMVRLHLLFTGWLRIAQLALTVDEYNLFHCIDSFDAQCADGSLKL